jgi:hypothetical protein
MAEIARDEGGDVEKASTGDPQQRISKTPKRESVAANTRATTTRKSKPKKASKA